MSEGVKVGQKMYLADMRDGVVVHEAEVVEVDRALMCVVCGSGNRPVWTAVSGFGMTWRPTRRAALERLRDDARSSVERCEQSWDNARYELTLVEAALSAEVDDA